MNLSPNTCAVFLAATLMQSHSIASPVAFVSLDAVTLLSDISHTQAINLFDTLGNTYITAHQWQHDESVLLGIGLRTYQQDGLDVNTSLRFLPMGTRAIHGDVLQLYSPRFRNLSYTYDVSTQLLLLDNIMTWTAHRLQPGLIAGLGRASNSATHYQETPLNEHAAPSLDHFSNQTRVQLAYELGAVLDYACNKDVIIEVAYRYLDAGQGQLGLSPLQNTLDHLSTGPLRYQTLSLGVRFSHAL